MVKDNGYGIKDEDKPKLFHIFGKVKQKNSRLNREGIGFGLMICRQICTEFGGYIDFDSTEDMGSTFYFTYEVNERQVTSHVMMDSEVLSTINDESIICDFNNFNETSSEEEVSIDHLVQSN